MFKEVGSMGTGVAGGRELPDVGAGKQTRSSAGTASSQLGYIRHFPHMIPPDPPKSSPEGTRTWY